MSLEANEDFGCFGGGGDSMMAHSRYIKESRGGGREGVGREGVGRGDVGMGDVGGRDVGGRDPIRRYLPKRQHNLVIL